jgi:hypothetical protein
LQLEEVSARRRLLDAPEHDPLVLARQWLNQLIASDPTRVVGRGVGFQVPREDHPAVAAGQRAAPLVNRQRRGDVDAASGLERVDDGVGEGEGAAAGAGVDGWGLLLAEGREQLVDVLVEGAVELAVDVVEVAGLPDAADLASDLGEGVTLDGVLDQEPAAGAVQLEPVGPGIGVGGVVGADQAPDRSVGEVQGGRTSASARSKTNGFSTNNGNPARMTLSVGSKWPSLARQIETRSGRSRSSISSRSA